MTHKTVDALPYYLLDYTCEHDLSRYTERDHAAWRYIMKRSHDFFETRAVSSYMSGFFSSGLQTDKIPSIYDIDQALQKFGWGAVPIVGYIAPWAFIEFQSRKILPIATNMRTVENIAYTPAPDIVHEAAGHIPFIPDYEYSNFLAEYSQMGRRAIYSRYDISSYEAIRYLSDLKSQPDAHPIAIAGAEERIRKISLKPGILSEQALVARMSIWTAEFGMSGSIHDPKIYGAGLLSSISESQRALTDEVPKIPLTLDCINYPFNVTDHQSQFFVAEDMRHMQSVTESLAETLAHRRGGVASLRKLKEADAIGTVGFETGSAVSGRVESLQYQGSDLVGIYFSGPCQLSWGDQQIGDHGPETYKNGYFVPLGLLSSMSRSTFEDFSLDGVSDLNGKFDAPVDFRYASGIRVRGVLKNVLRQEGSLLGIVISGLLVTRGDNKIYEDRGANYGLLFGSQIKSVWGGPADRMHFPETESTLPTSTPWRLADFSHQEMSRIKAYEILKLIRDNLNLGQDTKSAQMSLAALAEEALPRFHDEWLLISEIYELAREIDARDSWVAQTRDTLWELSKQDDAGQAKLVAESLRLTEEVHGVMPILSNKSA